LPEATRTHTHTAYTMTIIGLVLCETCHWGLCKPTVC